MRRVASLKGQPFQALQSADEFHSPTSSAPVSTESRKHKEGFRGENLRDIQQFPAKAMRRARKVRVLLMDVDGTMTDGGVTFTETKLSVSQISAIERGTNLPFLLQYPSFQPLHGEARFRRLARELGLDGGG